MKHLIIIGVGVFGDIVREYAVLSKAYEKEWDIKGFLYGDNDLEEDIKLRNPIAHYTDYSIEEDDVFICSYIDNFDRSEVYRVMNEKNAEFINVIHPSANIFHSVSLGKGNVIGAFTTLSANVSIGNMNIIQDHCNLGHDSVIGNYNHLFVGSVLCGKNKVSDQVSIFTGSLIYPQIRLGMSSQVAAGSVVMRNVKEGLIVMGNPAKRMDK